MSISATVLDQLKTGDILLFSSGDSGWWGAFSKLIQWGTHSPYTHVAMILRDPTFIHPSLKGLYVWESGWEGKPDPQDGQIKLGVQITPLHEIVSTYQSNGGQCYYRSILCDEVCFSHETLKEIHNNVYHKPYDICPLDWIEAYFQKDSNPQSTKRYWCSSFLGYIYVQCGILENDLDWNILRPSDFSLAFDNQFLYFNKHYKLLPFETLL